MNDATNDLEYNIDKALKDINKRNPVMLKEYMPSAFDNLDNPRAIFKNVTNSDYLIITIIKDNNHNNIVVPLEAETITNSNNRKIETNRIKSVYGFDNLRGYDLNDYVK